MNPTVVQEYFRDLKMEPSLCKFFSIISDIEGLRQANRDQKVVTWINNRIYDSSCIQKYTALRVNLRTVLKIARLYAGTLERYLPDEEGKIRQRFNFLHLASLLQQAFENHIDLKSDILTTGIKINVGLLNFFAKVELGQPFIFSTKTRAISSNRGIRVAPVYDLVSKQRLILKWADEPTAGEMISREVNNIRAIHARANYEGIDLDWMQDLPLATFKRDDFIAFLGVKYGKDLISIMDKDLPNEKRIALCKMVMSAYANLRKLHFWNGDFKADNIVRHGAKIVLIDWASARSLCPKVEKFTMPLAQTSIYMHPDLQDKMDAIIEKYKESGATDELKKEFIKTAEALELFSVAVTLFCILTSQHPFHLVYYDQYGANFPCPAFGFKKENWAIFLKKNYDRLIVQTIEEMLDYKDPISAPEAIAMWESIS